MYRKGRQATGRATLTPVERTKNGKTYWGARGSIPIRAADGSVGSRRIERGFGPDCTTEEDRYRKCAEWNAEYEERFRNPKRLITFAKAYKNYIAANHKVPYYAEEILAILGTHQCSDIDDSLMSDCAEEIWPDGASPGTINRHLHTPVIAILHQALKEKAPELTRPKGHRDVTPVIIPPEDWYRLIAPELNPDQLAFMMFLAMHGRRLSEALARQPKDLNDKTGILDLGKTKTGIREVVLEPRCLELITRRPGWRKMSWLFSYGPNSKGSIHRDMRAACERAGLKWYSPHKFGRHMSVTRMLRAGYSVAYVADAHGMTPEMVTRRYGHLTKKETTQALHQVGGELFDMTFGGGKAGDNDGVIEGCAARETDNDQILLAKLPPENLPIGLPSEGSALSSCATGAEEKPAKQKGSEE